MRQSIRWIVVVALLSTILLLRLSLRPILKTRLLFDKKQVVGLTFTTQQREEINIRKDNDNWIVVKMSSPTAQKMVYSGNTETINNLINQIKNFEVLELVSKSREAYEKFGLVEHLWTELKVTLVERKNKVKEEVIYLGKLGGFSFEESYAKLKGKEGVFLTKGISPDILKRPFYEFCDRRILKCNVEKLNSMGVSYKNKTISLKKVAEKEDIRWLNKKTNKIIEKQKIDNYFNLLKEFTGDSIADLLPDKTKPDFELTLKFEDNGEVKLLFYKKMATESGEFCFVRVKKILHSEAIEFVGSEEIFYGIYEFRYNDFKNQPENF